MSSPNDLNDVYKFLVRATDATTVFGEHSTTAKNFFSAWTSSLYTLDVTGGSFSAAAAGSVTLASGEVCQVTFTPTGTQFAGELTVSGSTYVPATGGGSDPGCAAFNATFSYTKSDSVLNVCGAGCDSYY